ncbi:MAG: carboxypeptidase regulatory-like domain-containing protein [Candidatus Hydrogenedentes bacterium]|nr:carboxypeptidase regulatory-like domain-containing protein [Candidatus Hydrogenedentota bacterium]
MRVVPIRNPQSAIRNPLVRSIALILAAAFVAPAALALNLTGAVVDSAGKPVAGASVWLCQDLEVAAAQSDAAGAFAFHDVRPEPALVVAKKDGYSLGAAEAQVAGAGPVAIALGQPDTLQVVVKDEQFALLPGVAITHLTVNGLLTIPAGLLAEKSNFPSFVSGDDGLIKLDFAPRGGMIGLVLSHRNCATAFAPFLKVSPAPVPVQMYPGATVRGRVSAPDAGPAPLARVALYRTDGESFEAPVLVVADPEGYYHAVVKPGDYYMAVRHPGYASPEPVKVPIPAGDEPTVVNLSLASPHVIAGKVLMPDGSPCPSVAVSYLVRGAIYAETLTQLDGSFRFLVPQAEGAVRVVAPPGYMTSDYLETPIKGELPERIELSPVGLAALPSIEGTVTGEDGMPSANVMVSSTNLEVQARDITGPDGRFLLRLVQAPPDGRVAVRAEHPQRFRRAEGEIDVKDIKPVNLTLEPFEPDLKPRSLQPSDNDLAEMIGRPAPPLDCASWLNSDPLTLDALRGKVVVLFFWGGFDDRPEPRDTLDELRALHDLYQPLGDVAIIAVHDSGSTDDEVRKYLETFNVTFPVGRDAEPGKTFEAYHVRYIPQVVMLDKKGCPRYFQTHGRLLELVKSLRRE